MTDQERVSKEITKIYPQLVINMRKVCGQGFDRWGYDLLSVAVEFFLTKPIEQQIRTIEEGKLENFITYIANIQLKSSSSKFYNVYRKPFMSSRELFDDYKYEEPENYNALGEEFSYAIDCIKCELEKLDVFERMVFTEVLVDGEKFARVAKKYNIRYYWLKTTAEEVKLKIKEKCRTYLEW